jgi:hypothetical protein
VEMTLDPEMKDVSLKDFEFVSFETIKECWNRYKLEDDTILKTKFVLVNLFAEKGFRERIRKAKADKVKIGLGFRLQPQTAIGIEVSPDKIGEPSKEKYPLQILEASVIKDEMEFRTTEETWNLYKLEEGVTLRIRNSPVRVRKTSKLDEMGLPIYIVDYGMEMRIA